MRKNIKAHPSWSIKEKNDIKYDIKHHQNRARVYDKKGSFLESQKHRIIVIDLKKELKEGKQNI